MDIVNLNSFLKFGYFLKYKPEYKISFEGIDKSQYENVGPKELVDKGIRLWKNAIEMQFETNQKHVVPLSGGIDSRAILATLLEFTEASNIYTYTFGTEGTLDFEIGKMIAKKVGTNHTQIPLSNYKYQMDDLLDISKRIDHQTLLFLHPPVSFLDELYSDFNVWSGAIIDVYFGRHTHKMKADNWDEAMLNATRENIYVKSINLCNTENHDFFHFMKKNDKAAEYLEREHILDLLNRQVKFIAPHVLMKGFNYKVLFQNKALTQFGLSIPDKYFNNQNLYKEMFISAFPKLFSLPCKTSNGLPLNASKFRRFTNKSLNRVKREMNKFEIINFKNKNVNYIDFNEEIRSRSDLKKIVIDNVKDLHSRNLIDWIDFDTLLKTHLDGKSNHGDALLTLTSLEIHLKAGLKI